MALGLSGCGLFDSSDAEGANTGGVGFPCEEPRDCREGLACEAGTCQPTMDQLEGGACKLSLDCMEGLYCNPNRVCATAGDAGVDERCTSTGDCQQGLRCAVQGFFARCVEPGGADLGQACDFNEDCLAGLTCAVDMTGERICQSLDLDADSLPPVPPDWDGAQCPTPTNPPRALFEVPREGDTYDDFFALPFPNDVRRTDTGLDLSGFPTPSTVVATDVMGRYVDAAEQDLEGFATNPVITFRFNQPYDFGDIRAGAIRLVNLETGTRYPGGLSWNTTAGRFSNYACPNILTIPTPSRVPLLPDTTYAFLLMGTYESPDGTVEVSTGDGVPFERSADLDALLAGTQPSDPVLADHWPKYQPLRDYLASNPDLDVLNATVFTTQDPEAMVPGLRQVVRNQPVPTLSDMVVCDEGVTSPCDDGTMQRSCAAADPDFTEIHGRVTVPVFQEGTAPYLTPVDGGGIETDGSGMPMVHRTEDVCFALTVPEGASMPAAGWPLAVHAHGTGGSFRSAVHNGLAGDLATGSPAVATLAIDLPQHGERRGGSDRPPEELFFNFANPRAARDNVMQGAADLMAVAFAAQNIDLPATSSPTGEDLVVDPSRIVLFAHSQGATHASLMLPYEPTYFAAVLSGNGGDLTQSLLTKTEPVDVQTFLPIALLDQNEEGNLPLGASHPALALWQMYFERVDPLNYARRLQRNPVTGDPGRHVFMTYGLGDSFSTEQTMTAFTLAGRLRIVEPLLPDAVLTSAIGGAYPTAPPPLSENEGIQGDPWTVGVRQYEPPTGVDGHFVATESTQGRADVLRFLRMAASGTSPEIGM